MLWIMGDVVKVDQFESVTIFPNLDYEYGLVFFARAYIYYIICGHRKQCLQMEHTNDNAMDKWI